MPNVKGTKKPNRTSDAGRSYERKTDRSSLDRLAEFTRRILRVTKAEAENLEKKAHDK